MRRTPMTQRKPLDALIHEVFRINGLLLAVGDTLVGHLGLTSARWQIIAAVGYLPKSRSVAGLASYIGLKRQGVQRIVNELAEENIVHFQDNPQHRRAKLVLLTKMGRNAYRAAKDIQTGWISSLSKGLNVQDIVTATTTMKTLRTRLEEQISEIDKLG